MNKKHTLLGLGIAAAAAIAVPGAAEATIYLMKGEKIVAAYPDDAVDYITFDEPEDPEIPDTYDVDTRSYFCNSNYYGDTQAAGGYNYAVQLIDLPFGDSGMIPADAVYFMLYLKGPEAADKNEPFVPEGTYRLAEVGDGGFAIIDKGSSVLDHYDSGTFGNAWLWVSKNAGKWKYEFTGVTREGKRYHTVFDGVPNAYDQSITWLEADQHIQGGTVSAFYRNPEEGLGNITIQIAENGYDEEGWLVTPGNYLTLVGNVEMDEKGNILPGEWTVVDEEALFRNTLLAGKCINFMGSAMPVHSNLKHWSDADESSVGLIKSGTMTVTKSKSGMTFIYDFTTDNGRKVTGVFSGQLLVADHPYGESLRLEDDYTLDLTDRDAVCMEDTYNGEVILEVSKFNSDICYVGDRVDLRLVPNNGVIELQPGVYSVDGTKDCVGKILPGTFVPQTGVGDKSVFVKYAANPAETVLKAAGIEGGQVEVIKNGDGTWTLKYDLLDGQDTPRHIRGAWTGNFRDL